MIKERQIELKSRAKPSVHIKYISSGSKVVNDRRKEYEYYICDYCKEEIIIKEDKIKQAGGTLKFRGMELALHNKCLNPAIKEFE